jgi:hypothetical protein
VGPEIVAAEKILMDSNTEGSDVPVQLRSLIFLYDLFLSTIYCEDDGPGSKPVASLPCGTISCSSFAPIVSFAVERFLACVQIASSHPFPL